MSTKTKAAELATLSAAWLGLTMADVQVFVSIASGLAVAVYTALNIYVLWRDKIKRRE